MPKLGQKQSFIIWPFIWNYFLLIQYNKYYYNNRMQPEPILGSPRSGTSTIVGEDSDKNDLSFKWATHIQFSQHSSLKFHYVSTLIKTNSKYFQNCLVYVKDKKQAQSYKGSIEKQTKILTTCVSTKQILDIMSVNNQCKVFIVPVQNNNFEDYFVPFNFDFIINTATPTSLKDYQKLVRKDIQLSLSQRIERYGVVINYCSFSYQREIISKFTSQSKVAIRTFQQLKQNYNLQIYFKPIESKINHEGLQKKQKNEPKRIKLELAESIGRQEETFQNLAISNNIKWATYLIINTEQQYKAGRTMNYINKNSSKFASCLVYAKHESRAKFINQRIAPPQLKNATSIVVNYPENYREYLQKLEKGELKILIIVASKQDTEKAAVNFYVPKSVDMIIIDGMPSSFQIYKQRIAKFESSCSGVVINMLSSDEEINNLKNYCKKNELTINQQHRKDDYELEKYLKQNQLISGQKSSAPQSPRANTQNLVRSISPKSFNSKVIDNKSAIKEEQNLKAKEIKTSLPEQQKKQEQTGSQLVSNAKQSQVDKPETIEVQKNTTDKASQFVNVPSSQETKKNQGTQQNKNPANADDNKIQSMHTSQQESGSGKSENKVQQLENPKTTQVRQKQKQVEFKNEATNQSQKVQGEGNQPEKPQIQPSIFVPPSVSVEQNPPEQTTQIHVGRENDKEEPKMKPNRSEQDPEGIVSPKQQQGEERNVLPHTIKYKEPIFEAEQGKSQPNIQNPDTKQQQNKENESIDKITKLANQPLTSIPPKKSEEQQVQMEQIKQQPAGKQNNIKPDSTSVLQNQKYQASPIINSIAKSSEKLTSIVLALVEDDKVLKQFVGEQSGVINSNFKICFQKQDQLSAKIAELPDKLEESNKRIQQKIAAVYNDGQTNASDLSQAIKANAQSVVESISNGLNNLQHTNVTNFQSQKQHLEKSVTRIKNLIEEEGRKNLDRISEVHKDTILIQGIASEAKIIKEAVSPISTKLETMQKNLSTDIKQLSKCTKLIGQSQNQQTSTLINQIKEASSSTNLQLKEVTQQQRRDTKSIFDGISAKQDQIQKKLDQVPEKLEHISTILVQQVGQVKSTLQEKTQFLQATNKQQAIKNKQQIISKVQEQSQKNRRLISAQNKLILNYIDKEKGRITKSGQQMVKEINMKKLALENEQKKRMKEFQDKVNAKQTTQTDIGLATKLGQLEKKYNQNLQETVDLRQYKANAIETSKELDRVRVQLQDANKIATKFIEYKKKYANSYDILNENYKQKQKQCERLESQKNVLQNEVMATKTELSEVKELIYNFLQMKPEKKETEGPSIKKMLNQNATAMLNQKFLNSAMTKQMQIAKLPKQAQTMSLSSLIKTYLIAQINTVDDLRPSLINLAKVIPLKESDNTISESAAGRELRANCLKSVKSISKEKGAYHLINSLVKLIEEYDNLKKYQLSIMKYCQQLQGTLKNLNEKSEQSAKKCTQISMPKILDYTLKQSASNKDIQNICENYNRLISTIISKNGELAKANQKIEELKNSNNAQSGIIKSLNIQKTNLKSELSAAATKLGQCQVQLTEAQTSIRNLTGALTKTQGELAAANKNIDQTNTQLKSKIGILKQTELNLVSTRANLDQTQAELVDTKETLRLKVKDIEGLQKQLKTKQDELVKLNRSYQDEKKRALESADDATRKYEQLRLRAEQKLNDAARKYSELEEASEKQLADQRNRNRIQVQKKVDEIQKIKQQNAKQKDELFKKMKSFQATVNSSINNVLDYEIKASINSYQGQFKAFQKAIPQKLAKLTFLSESSTYRGMDESDKKFVYNSIKRIVCKKIEYTKTLFEGESGVNFDQWLLKIYGKPNLLVLITLSNGHKIGGFSENPFSKEKSNSGKGYMMSVTNKRIYDIKARHEGKVAKYDDFMFVFGNNELLIKNNLTFNAIFAKQFCYFETGDDTIKDFLGQDSDEGTFKSVQFHQVVFSRT